MPWTRGGISYCCSCSGEKVAASTSPSVLSPPSSFVGTTNSCKVLCFGTKHQHIITLWSLSRLPLLSLPPHLRFVGTTKATRNTFQFFEWCCQLVVGRPEHIVIVVLQPEPSVRIFAIKHHQLLDLHHTITYILFESSRLSALTRLPSPCFR